MKSWKTCSLKTHQFCLVSNSRNRKKMTCTCALATGVRSDGNKSVATCHGRALPRTCQRCIAPMDELGKHRRNEYVICDATIFGDTVNVVCTKARTIFWPDARCDCKLIRERYGARLLCLFFHASCELFYFTSMTYQACLWSYKFLAKIF